MMRALLACWLASTSAAPSSDDAIVIVEDDASPAVSAAEPVGLPLPAPRLNFALTSRLLFNTHMGDSSVEVFQMWHWGTVHMEQNATDALGATVEVAARWGVLGNSPADGPMLLVNIREPQWVGEVQLREAYGRWRGGPWSINLGARRYAWGKNEFLSPADLLNPLDLRYDPTLAFVLPATARAPIFAADVSYAFTDTVRLQLVVSPFFANHRLFYWGHDTSVLANTQASTLLTRLSQGLEANARDRLEEGAVGTALPSFGPQGSTMALRASWRWGGWDLAATGFWGWDRTPWVLVDTSLAEGIARTAAGSASNTTAVLAALEQAVLSGGQLLSATYVRTGALALEGEGVVGPLVLRADVGWNFNQVVYTNQLTPLQRPALRGILSADYLQGDQWFASIGVYANGVWEPPNNALLVGVEAPSASLDRAIALNWGTVVSARWHWQDPSIELRGNAAYDFELGDYVAWMQLSYSPWDTHTFAVGATLLGGDTGTVGAQFAKNDLIFCQYQTAW